MLKLKIILWFSYGLYNAPFRQELVYYQERYNSSFKGIFVTHEMLYNNGNFVKKKQTDPAVCVSQYSTFFKCSIHFSFLMFRIFTFHVHPL